MNVYSVLTEFKFDVAEAVANSKTLQDQLQKVSGAADAVQTGLQNAAMSMLGQIGLYGGLTGAIYSAVKAADKYQQTQRSIANIFLSNNMFSGPKAFEASMQASAEAMENMKKTARQFSLPVADFVTTAKLVGAGLVNHGLDTANMEKTIMLTRGYLKSAPMLGIDPGMAQGELMDMVNGRAHMSARLAQRLVNETAAMRPFGAGAPSGRIGGMGVNSGLAKFNALTPEKRLETLTAALMQFGSNAKIVEENAKSLASQMQRLTDNITGMFSILKPIGDAILEPLKGLMLKLNLFLEGAGENVIKKFGAFLAGRLNDPTQLFADIQQMRHLKSDTAHAGEILFFSTVIHSITAALRFLGFELKGGLINSGLQLLISGIKKFASWGGFELIATTLGTLFSYLVREVFPPIILAQSILQGISRGFALADVMNAQWLLENAERITDVIGEFKNAFGLILAPFRLVVDGIAMITSHLVSHNIAWDLTLDLLDRLAFVLKVIGEVIVFTLGVISGTMQMMMTIMDAITSRTLSKLKTLPSDFEMGFDWIWKKFHKIPLDVDNSATSQKVVNINEVNINNQFKEQMEPDRIAFSLKEQLLKADANRTRGKGGSMMARAGG